ncbi:unnamed protein product [Arctia plantaginis]|uniref:Mitochondrial glutamate carrier 2 n=1 Tax=Arctia plantaginis TaxID=874455 RepID=A0A8S0ZUL3_ARCPL|nr:unnamed protein product [Arctia plantaginis]CAB3238442.1 unnamed protein product [Arctia plantaginis]
MTLYNSHGTENLQVWTYNIIKIKMSSKQPPPPTPQRTFSLLPKAINGGIAGIVGVSVVFPLDLVKTRLQNQVAGPNGEKMYSSMLDCFKKTYAAEGYFGMYRGSAVNIVLVSPEKAIKLSANDMFRFYLTLPDGSLPIVRQMLAGGLAGALQTVITTPMELLKIQMQDQGRITAQAKTGGAPVKKLTAVDLTKNLIAERGIFGLYKGVLACIVREVPFGIIYFPMFATLADLGVQENEGQAPLWWMFVSGCSAGSTAAWCVTPFDVVKTRMQTLTKGTGEVHHNSMLECLTSIWKNEGITALFKGGACRMMVIAPLLGIAQSVYYLGVAETLFDL